MKIKTEKKAIQESIFMWYWLYKTPKENKVSYIMSSSTKKNEWLADCACCEYYLEFLEEQSYNTCAINIGECPLRECAICSFSGDNSAFSKWYNKINKKENAKKILLTLIDFWKEKKWKNKKIGIIIKDIEKNQK